MAKRRTKKEKQDAKHVFTYTWTEAEKSTSTSSVNREIKTSHHNISSYTKRPTNTEGSELISSFSLIKVDIVKSLILASLILALEVVIYFIWF